MTEVSDRFLHAISELGEVMDATSSEEAAASFDESTLQLFWREWPHLSSWAGTLWRRLDEDLAGPAEAVSDELDEVGGGD